MTRDVEAELTADDLVRLRMSALSMALSADCGDTLAEAARFEAFLLRGGGAEAPKAEMVTKAQAVASLMDQGFQPKAIAERLGISIAAAGQATNRIRRERGIAPKPAKRAAALVREAARRANGHASA